MDGYYLNGQEETDGKSYGFRSVKMVYIEQLELCPVKASNQTDGRVVRASVAWFMGIDSNVVDGDSEYARPWSRLGSKADHLHAWLCR